MLLLQRKLKASLLSLLQPDVPVTGIYRFAEADPLGLFFWLQEVASPLMCWGNSTFTPNIPCGIFSRAQLGWELLQMEIWHWWAPLSRVRICGQSYPWIENKTLEELLSIIHNGFHDLYCSMEAKNPAADCIQLPLVWAQPGERMAGASLSLPFHGVWERDRGRAVWAAARSLDAVSFHDSGRSLW